MENTIQSDLIRGHINTIILKALFNGDRYGYDIIREIEQKSSGQYKLKQPTLYSCLNRLEIQGFIRSYWGAKSNGGRRKYFTLTDMGRELFIKNQSEWEYSRTVIDKLISDKEVDLSAMTSVSDSSDSEETNNEQTADKEIQTSESAESATDSYNNIYTDYVAQNSEPAEQADKENFETATFATADESENTENGLEIKQPAFSDTTQIMSELLRQQETCDNASYTEKLVSEIYVSDKTDSNTLSGDTYFKDFFEEESVTNNYENFAQSEYPPSVDSVKTPEYEEPSKTSNMFLDYHSSKVVADTNNSVIEREYRNILGDFLNQSFVEHPSQPIENENPQPRAAEEEFANFKEKENSNEPEENNYDDCLNENAPLESYTNDADVNRKLNRITGEVREMGDNVVIRTHNNASAKEYSNTYYYYSNKLMLVHYSILFAIMMLEILFTAVFVNLILDKGQNSDKWFYILAVITAVVFPVVAFIKNFTMPNKRKRINFSLKNSLIYRFIIMAQCFLIIYCLNIIGGMQLSFDSEHITTVLMPALLCTGFPVSALIFNALFKTKRFSVEQ